MVRQQWLVFLPVTLATAGLAACASMLGGDEVQVRPVDTLATQAAASQHDPLYESAVAAVKERDYGRALDYLQAAKAKDPRNVKALNALGVVYDKLGRFDLSARYYAQARAVEPDSKIVAENMGYSNVLQRLINPNAPVAVATIDLPNGLVGQAAPSSPSTIAAPGAEKPATAVALNSANAAVPALPQPEARQVAVPSALLASANGRNLTAAPIASPPVLPFPQPEARQVAVRSTAFDRMSLTAASLGSPDLPMPEPEARQVAVRSTAFDRKSLTSASLGSPDLPMPEPEARQVAVPSVGRAGQSPLTAAFLSSPDLPVPEPEARKVALRSTAVDNFPLTAASPESLDLPMPEPDARQVAVPPVGRAGHPSLTVTSLSSPDLPMPEPQARQIMAPSIMLASALPVTTVPSAPVFPYDPPAEIQAMPASVLAKPELAASAPRATVVPVASPLEWKSAPAADFPVVPPVEKKVAAPSNLATAYVTPALKRDVIPAMAAAEPAAPERKPILLAAVPAVPPLPSKTTERVAKPVVARLAEPAPKPAMVQSVRAAAASPAAKPVVSTMPPTVHPAALSPVTKAPERKIEVAVLHQASVVPAQPSAMKRMFLALAALPARFMAASVAKPAAPVVKTAMAKAVSAKPTPVKMAVAQPAPADMAAIKPASPVFMAAIPPAKKFLTIGQPVTLQNASGKAGGTAPVLRRLVVLGWTMRPSDARAQATTMLYYSAQNVAAAKALQRTLPFPAHLAVDRANASGMRLVIGRDYLFWKPRNAHIAALWQKSAIIALLQKPSIRGVR